MPAIEIGRLVVKNCGREATNKAVIIEIIDKNFVLITGAGISPVRRRRSNIKHLEPLEHSINVSRGASDDEIARKLQDDNLATFLAESVKIIV